MAMKLKKDELGLYNSEKSSNFAAIMAFSVLTYRLRSWLKFHLTAWNTGGEGVHSPYLFEWVRMVMSDKHSFYGWSAIEECRRDMMRDDRELRFVDYGSGANGAKGKESIRRVCDIARGSLTKRRYAQMLSRLVNWLGGQFRDRDKGLTIVEFGTSLGITTSYLAMVDHRDRVVTCEGCESVADIARTNWSHLGLQNIDCRVGEIGKSVLIDDIERIDIAYLDADHTYASTRDFFNMLALKAHEKTVIVVDDIHHSAEMERAWKEICADERVSSTMDLYQMGMVFFDKHYWRRNYKLRL